MIHMPGEPNFVEVRGARLHYERSGSGSPIVFVHSAGSDLRMWALQERALSSRFTVIRYDLRGLGMSNYTNDERFFPYDDLHSLIAAMKLGRTHLVGVELGARICLDFALVWPEQVDRMVLVAPGITGEPPAAQVNALKRRYEEASPALAVDVTEAWMSSHFVGSALEEPLLPASKRARQEPDTALGPSLMRGLHPGAWQRLHELRAPMLVMLGDRDPPGVVSNGELLVKHGAKTRTLPGHGELLNLERPDEFNQQLMEFFEP